MESNRLGIFSDRSKLGAKESMQKLHNDAL